MPGADVEYLRSENVSATHQPQVAPPCSSLPPQAALNTKLKNYAAEFEAVDAEGRESAGVTNDAPRHRQEEQSPPFGKWSLKEVKGVCVSVQFLSTCREGVS